MVDGVTTAVVNGGAPRLEILKTLGDNTRYAIYLELARSPQPLATADIARSLDLHPNTVRPHLERMREVGLLEQRVDTRGGVGRPQHLYSLAPDARSRSNTVFGLAVWTGNAAGAFVASSALAHSGWLAVCAISAASAAGALAVQLLGATRRGAAARRSSR